MNNKQKAKIKAPNNLFIFILPILCSPNTLLVIFVAKTLAIIFTLKSDLKAIKTHNLSLKR